MDMNTKAIYIDSNPNNVVPAEIGTFFIRENDQFYVRDPRGKVTKLQEKYKPKDYNRVGFKRSLVIYKTKYEIWEKVEGNGTNRGWKFVAYRKYFTEQPTGQLITPTPTPEPTPTPSATPEPTPMPTPEPTPTATESSTTQYFLTVDPNTAYISSSVSDAGLSSEFQYEITSSISAIQIWEVSGSIVSDETGSKMWSESNVLLGTVNLAESGSTNVDITSYVLAKTANSDSALVFTAVATVDSSNWTLMTNATTSLNTLNVHNVRVSDVFQNNNPYPPVSNVVRIVPEYGPAIRGDYTQHAVGFSDSPIGKQATFTLSGMYNSPIDLVFPFPNYRLDVSQLTGFMTGGIDENGLGFSNYDGTPSDSITFAYGTLAIAKVTGSMTGSAMNTDNRLEAGYVSPADYPDTSSIDITSLVVYSPFTQGVNNWDGNGRDAMILSIVGDYSSTMYDIYTDLAVVTSSIVEPTVIEADNIPQNRNELRIVDATGSVVTNVNFTRGAIKLSKHVDHGSAVFSATNVYNHHPVVTASLPPIVPPV